MAGISVRKAFFYLPCRIFLVSLNTFNTWQFSLAVFMSSVLWLHCCRMAKRRYITQLNTELRIVTSRWRDCCLATAQTPTSATRFVFTNTY